MASTYADIMHRLLTLVAQHGKPVIVAGDGEVIIYTQTSNKLENGYFPTHTDGYDEDETQAILDLAEDAGIGLYYFEDYHDTYSDATFTAFIISNA